MTSQRSLWDAIQEQKLKYCTLGNKASDFEIGDHVKVITYCQDFHFFDGDCGKVVEISDGTYGVKIKFDIDRVYEEFTMTQFSFEPSDLILTKKLKKIEKKWIWKLKRLFAMNATTT